jgi:hypothetical protein
VTAPAFSGPTWTSLQAYKNGVSYVPHAVLTFAGTWAAPGTGYPSNVVDGLTQFVNPNLVVEVPVIAPWSFGILGPGGATADSYDQSIEVAIEFAGNWMADNPTQTFALGGYSQGAEASSRVAIELAPGGSLAEYAENFIGGYTFGNPCRMLGSIAPGVTNPGNYRGISSVNMTALPEVGGQVVWADYVHSPANGDAGLDMYAAVSNDAAGELMTQWYTTATVGDINNLSDFTSFIVDALKAIASDVTDLVGGFEAAEEGLKFVAASGGATAPHISYLGELAGYSNLVADAVGFLNTIATLTPARA